MKKRLFLIPILLLALVSCAYNSSLVQSSYKVLAVSQTTYDTSMKAAADLYKQGKFGEDVKSKILKTAETYHKVHNSAVNALAKYEETYSSADANTLESQISLVSETLANLLSIIKPYLEK